MSISLATEFLVIGLMPFLTIAFAILSVFRVFDLSFLSQAKDSLVLLVIVATLPVYLLGALLQTLADLLNTHARCIKYPLRKLPILQRCLKQSEPTNLDEWAEWMVLIMQFGSECLNKELENDWSLLRIFKSTALSAPMLTISLCIWLSRWLSRWTDWRSMLAVSLTGISLTCVAIASFLIQRQLHWRTVQISVKLIKEDMAT